MTEAPEVKWSLKLTGVALLWGFIAFFPLAVIFFAADWLIAVLPSSQGDRARSVMAGVAGVLVGLPFWIGGMIAWDRMCKRYLTPGEFARVLRAIKEDFGKEG